MTEQTTETPHAPGTPAGTEPVAPTGTEPGAPAGTEPAALAGTEPAGTEPAGTEPAGTEPAGTEPAGTEPAGTVPAVPADSVAPAPQVPGHPPAPPLPTESPRSPRPPRRVLRAVARWTVAVLVLGGLGAGTALGITSMERTDVPGLATESDGRWDYPELSLPALPAGSPRPFSESNVAEIHHADLRRLLLPAPAGATVDDKELDGGWVSTEQYLSAYAKDERSDIAQVLKDSAPRHVAARGWTMPDGTSTRIYLLQFNSTAFAQYFRDAITEDDPSGVPLAGTSETAIDEDWKGAGKVEGTASYVYSEQKPYGEAQVRHGYVVAGDTLALVVQSRKGKDGTPSVPFHQTLILQNQLLG
ncbi:MULTISPECIES: hypothetical protein [unclassified Streptomyces]|uniref:hypothetical protein n=1 Tax=unclassified Streptomyces TaxID=2593676 RepID=UPI0036DFC128